eukprot:symbB.v1.2.014395.t1/scaffold1053.1/size141410/2
MDDPAATSLVNVWSGTTDEDGSQQTERLVLNADGTFEHQVAHSFGRDSAASTECCGHWEVHKVRHMGADLQAEGDRELVFKKSAAVNDALAPLITERLVVCGANPVVNGFVGASCRLYPAAEADTAAEATVAGEEAETAEPETAENADESEGEEIQELQSTKVYHVSMVHGFRLEVDDADLQLLHETTGQPKDRCLAALLNVAANVSSEARLETAAAELMDEVDAQEATGSNDRATGSFSASASASLEEQLQLLMGCTGRSEVECREALKKHPNVDAAAEMLLTEVPEEAPEMQPAEEPPNKRPRVEE